MTESQAIERLSQQRRFHASSTLKWMKMLMERLGNPQERLRFIHVTGTNGKGSTCTMLASVLRQAGVRVGLFQSPYVLHFRERMQVDGVPISPAELAEWVARIDPVVREMEQEGGEVTEFEFVTALAFCWFLQKQCEVVVLEVGVGGLYDSTNVIPAPLVSVFTPISLDHTALLGESLEEIAREKGGILKPGSVAVLAPNQPPEAASVLRALARERNIPLREARLAEVQVEGESLDGLRLRAEGMELFLPLLGAHQVQNAATALAVLGVLRQQGFSISPEQIRTGFAQVRFPARLEVLRQAPPILLDGAHNPGGLRVLRDAVQNYLPGKRCIALTGMMADKDCAAAPALFKGFFEAVVTVAPSQPRALEAQALAELWQNACAQVLPAGSVEEAVAQALSLAGKEGAVIAFGSLLLAAELRPVLCKKIETTRQLATE